MRSRAENIAVLSAHRQNLERANTFQDWKAAHLAYVELLIEEMEAEERRVGIVTGYVTKAEWKEVDPETKEPK